jgi:hypothetical protein
VIGPAARANRARARRQIIAAAAAALEVLDLRARYVSETDDRPRAWLERFARGEDRIGACPWRTVKDDRPLFALLHRLSDAREDVWRHPTHAEGQAWSAVMCLARILHEDCGEPEDASRERADTIYRAHLARLEREAVEAMLTERAPAQRARAAAATTPASSGQARFTPWSTDV